MSKGSPQKNERRRRSFGLEGGAFLSELGSFIFYDKQLSEIRPQITLESSWMAIMENLITDT